MIIGIPREIKGDENRVSLTPDKVDLGTQKQDLREKLKIWSFWNNISGDSNNFLSA